MSKMGTRAGFILNDFEKKPILMEIEGKNRYEIKWHADRTHREPITDRTTAERRVSVLQNTGEEG